MRPPPIRCASEAVAELLWSAWLPRTGSQTLVSFETKAEVPSVKNRGASQPKSDEADLKAAAEAVSVQKDGAEVSCLRQGAAFSKKSTAVAAS